MNIIWNKLNELKPKYWIHMEDDFLFHRKLDYITKGIEGLKSLSNQNVKQILFNINYSEIVADYKMKGHININNDFSIHNHNSQKTDSNYPNCHYWPHYSFRPSIIDTDVILQLGNFDSSNQFFEMDYANKWTKAGYKSGFFNAITNRHIGRLTSERFNNEHTKNAYELNNESQFSAISPNDCKNLISKNNATEFIFIPRLDQHDKDIYHMNTSTISKQDLLEKAATIKGCVGVNTLGFFKSCIEKLQSSKYFGQSDGIYIKKDCYQAYNKSHDEAKMDKKNNIIRIKMLSNWWSSSEKLCEEWSNMCEKNNQWKNLRIVSNDIAIDYYIILNSPPAKECWDPNKTIVFQLEPWVDNPSYNWGVKTWGKWSTPSSLDFMAVRGRKNECPNTAFWQLELPLKDLINLKYEAKEAKISTICSSKYFDVGHIHRIDFLKFLEEKGDIPLDIFNENNNHKFGNYRGKKTPYVDKSTGIVPYKYYFMVENNYEKNFITEKMWEPILCESLVFYDGCPNITDYIDNGAFVQIDMLDFEKSYKIIKTAIEEDWWSQRIDMIRLMKKKILEELAFFPTVKRIIDDNLIVKSKDPTNDPTNDPKLNYCFIHSCTLPLKKTEHLDYIVNYLKKSQLFDSLERVYINNIGMPIEDNYGNKIKVTNYSDNPKLYEIPTLNRIKNFSQAHPNSNILYIHTKGVTHTDERAFCVQDWTNLMLYFLIDRYETSLNHLQKFDSVGCNHLLEPWSHFSGNFWWAQSDYLKTLYTLEETNRQIIHHLLPLTSKHHLEGEEWILSATKNYKSLHNSNKNHYQERYDVSNYR